MLEAKGLTAFHAEIKKTWEALPPLKASEEWTEKYRYIRLSDILERQAREKNNPARIIELKAKTATHTRDFIVLSKYRRTAARVQSEAQFH